MNSGRTNDITNFEEKEKKIMEFEVNYKQKEQQLSELSQKCQDLEQKLKDIEGKSSQDEVVATQLNELRQKIEQDEKTIQELNEMSSRLRGALENIQEENIKMEDELNRIKSDHGAPDELKSKLAVLEDTVITQQKEIIEKDKILKERATEDTGNISESEVQKFIVGKVQTIKEFNRLLESVKFRLFLIVPTIEDFKQLKIKRDPKVDTRVATAFDPSDDAHRNLIRSFPDVDFRNYPKKDRWGIERDAEEICLVAESENKDYIGISSTDSKICELFLKLLTEAWLTASKIS